jgi:hypothetical protein
LEIRDVLDLLDFSRAPELQKPGTNVSYDLPEDILLRQIYWTS